MDDLTEGMRPMSGNTWVDLRDYQSKIDDWIDGLEEIQARQRIWARDGSLWTQDPQQAQEIVERLGWLELPQDMRVETTRLKALALEVRASGIEHITLLGMGGSSLAPEVMQYILGQGENHCSLTVLDSTDPNQIQQVEAIAPLEKTLFVAASKSGTTAETRALLEYFAHKLETKLGLDQRGQHLLAITDPGTELARLARDEGYRALYENPGNVGGRYSALSFFGLVPAALIGIDVNQLLDRGRDMAWLCRATAPSAENPGLVLGAILGHLAVDHGYDKLSLLTSPEVAAFGAWVEQLIAESTGKRAADGTRRGILPIVGEPILPAERYSRNRLFVYLRLTNGDNDAIDRHVADLKAAGHPLVVLELNDRFDLGKEFFRWEFATAIAGVLMNINPFDQPDVELAKRQAREALRAFQETQSLPEAEPLLEEDSLRVYGTAHLAEPTSVAGYLDAFLSNVPADDYVAIMAYVARNEQTEQRLQHIRAAIGQRTGAATTLGFGPRFLHSTGQLHKGGPCKGWFLQITQRYAADLPIPNKSYSFGTLIKAQALGDMRALQEKQDPKRVIRIDIGPDTITELEKLANCLGSPLK